jgi:Phage Mu protein F like protein
MTTAEFNRVMRAMGRTALESEEALAVAYERVWLAAGRYYASQFGGEAVTASANWVPPAGAPPFESSAAMSTIDQQRADAADAIERQFSRSVTGSDLAISFDPKDFRMFSPDLMTSIGQHAGANFDAAARDELQRVIRGSFDSGLTVPQTAKEIRRSFGDVSKSRATMLARTDLISLANGGSYMAARKVFEKVVVNKVWLNAHDGRVRPSHAAAGGQVVPMDAPFSVGGFDLMYPGDPQGPAGEVINCRCTYTVEDPPKPKVAEREEAGAGARATALLEETKAKQGGLFEVLTDPTRAAKVFVDGIRAREIREGNVPDEGRLAGALENWTAHILKSLDKTPDPAAIARAETAGEYNLTSAIHRAAVDRYGPERVLILKEGEIAPLLNPGGDLAAAHRLTGPQVTVVRRAALEEKRKGSSWPGDSSSMSDGGFEALLRHEYGHQIWDEMSGVEREAFRQLIRESGADVKDTLTKYAGSKADMEEAFTEAYAVVADPAFVASRWAPWVNRFKTDLERKLIAEARDEIPAPQVGTGPPTMPSSFTTVKEALEWAGQQGIAKEASLGTLKFADVKEVLEGLATVAPYIKRPLGSIEVGPSGSRTAASYRYFPGPGGAPRPDDRIVIQRAMANQSTIHKTAAREREKFEMSNDKTKQLNTLRLADPGRPEPLYAVARQNLERAQETKQWTMYEHSERPTFTLMAHEAAHFLYFDGFLAHEWSLALKARGLEGRIDGKHWRVSEYGSTNKSELFAEVFAARASGLTDRIPAEFLDAMEEVLEGVAKRSVHRL